jgi:hypothetical protein
MKEKNILAIYFVDGSNLMISLNNDIDPSVIYDQIKKDLYSNLPILEILSDGKKILIMKNNILYIKII